MPLSCGFCALCQVAYTGLLQMFLTPRALCLVVCDAREFGRRTGDGSERDGNAAADVLEELLVFDWLRAITWRVPDNDAILVATKCDLTPGAGAAQVAQRMNAACQEWLQEWSEDGMPCVRVEDGVCLTSCSKTAAGDQQQDDLQRTQARTWASDWSGEESKRSHSSLLNRILHKPNIDGNMADGGGPRAVRMVVPRSWHVALTMLDALEFGK